MLLNYKSSSFYYTRQGNGNALVLLHGFLENQTMWEPFISQLSDNHTVITIDLPGHGKSDCLGYIHTMEQMAEVVEAVLVKESITEANFIGHSMGGYVALAFAERYPKKCSGIVLVNSTTKADSPERKKNRDRAIALVKKHKEAFLSMAIANLFAEENREKFATAIRESKQTALEMPVQGIIAALEGMKIRKDRTYILKQFSKPKQIIAGTKDPIIPFDKIKNLAIECKCSFQSLIGGHMSTIENRDELLNIMYFIE
ncbi:alpha/beta hydrolase [uncultured Planktosalinus sp.]|uniref:alpha/beta fold hydrolase n=1 Tax=uncultured Planktosalinus sp. TaxID=1810935 RepID=UPI0030D6E522